MRMRGAVADTHTLLWYGQQPSMLSRLAREALDQAIEDVGVFHISTISLVEIV